MINTSNEYKQYIADTVNSTLSREFTAKVDIELANSTVLNIAERDIVVKGLKISDATSSSNNFQIGSAIINQCILMLNNIGGKFDQYDFTDAIIRPYVGLKLSQTTEWLKKGIFTVDEPTVASSIISLVALDNMNKFDTPFSNVIISFPCSQLQLLQAVCLYCGVYLATNTFTNSDFIVTRRPDDEAITCREIVAWIAQNSGNFARCNTDGALELKWYDMTAFEQIDDLDGGIFDSNTPYSSGDNANGGDFTFSETTNYDGGTFLQMEKYHHIYALNQATIGTDDVIITGIQVKAKGTQSDYGETVLFGAKGYVIEITNPLITENTASIIANSVGAKIVGMRFRPCNISALSDPSREAGDIAYLSHKNNTYQILLTNVSYQIGGNDNISCDAETPSRKQSVRFDASTKAIVEARKIAQEKLTAYDIAVKQLNSVMANAMGYYPTSETQEDGSTIDYMHDKPTLAESVIIWKKSIDGFAVSTDGGQTYTSGFTADGNIIAKTLSVIGINAEWIKVLTSFTVGEDFSVDKLGHLISKSGEIGPFKLDKRGFFSKMISIYEDTNYPLIWMTEPDEDLTENSGGYAFGGEGSARANYEPSVCMVRKVENGIETNVSLAARGTNVGAGAISIDKYEGSSAGGNLISEQFIADGNITYNEYDSSGNQTKSYEISPWGITYSDSLAGKMVGFFIDTDTGELFMQADRIELSGDVYINGVKK